MSLPEQGHCWATATLMTPGLEEPARSPGTSGMEVATKKLGEPWLKSRWSSSPPQAPPPQGFLRRYL